MQKPKHKSMIINRILFCLAFVGFTTLSYAQMPNGLYGNEWIQYDQSYHKVKITEAGLYTISATVAINWY